PAVSIAAPSNGATVSGTVNVSANATDDTRVAGVQFLLDGANLGVEVTAAPYTIAWTTTTAANGAHALTARARDAAGNPATSAGALRRRRSSRRGTARGSSAAGTTGRPGRRGRSDRARRCCIGS